MHERCYLLLLLLLAMPLVSHAQTDDGKDDVWREVSLDELDFKKEKNYCMRLYGYYRCVDDGTFYGLKRQDKFYRVYEGICEVDVRYDRKEDDGAVVIVGRNLVHPEQAAHAMEFYELQPYTFLEKAQRKPKQFQQETKGDTTYVYMRRGLAGMAVADTARHELRMTYNALAPDTVKTINLIVVNAKLNNVQADAVYHMDDNRVEHVPQGNLKHITFDGDIDLQIYPGMGTMNVDDKKELLRTVYHEHSELYVDSVVYMTRNEFRADRKLSSDERLKRTGYTMADIDRLREKLGVPALDSDIMQRIEDQRDWEDMTDHWEHTHALPKTINKMGGQMEKAMEKAMENEKVQKAVEKATKAIENNIEKQIRKNDEE